MTPQELLDRIPTVQELLDHPRVQQVAESWNRSAVSARLRAAITEVGAEVARRTEPWQSMTAGELVEDLLRRVGPSPKLSPSPVINATGRWFRDDLVGPPLADAAVGAVSAFAAGYGRREDGDSDRIAALVGADRAWVASSHSAAVSAFLGAFGGDKPLLIARSDMGRLRDGVRLESVCQSVGVAQREIGVAEGATPEDYEAALATLGADARGTLVYVRRRDDRDSLQSIAATTRSAGALLMVDVAEAAPIDLKETHGVGSVTAESTLAAGAELIAFNGDGLFGGPESAVICGTRHRVDELANSPAADSRRAPAIIREMLCATAELFRDPARLRFTHPLYELLSAPVDNLRTRVERLAPQVAEHTRVELAEPLAIPAATTGVTGLSPSLDSWGVALAYRGESAEESRERLMRQHPSVCCEIAAGLVRIDLRTVFPRQDMALVAALA